jgi:hypothetical protein
MERVMRKANQLITKIVVVLVGGIGLIAGPLYGQLPTVKRHPGEQLRYKVMLEGRDLDKITNVELRLYARGGA